MAEGPPDLVAAEPLVHAVMQLVELTANQPFVSELLPSQKYLLGDPGSEHSGHRQRTARRRSMTERPSGLS